MLGRAALVLLLIVLSGAAALFAAGHFGLRLPWDIVATTAPESAGPEPGDAAADRDAAAKTGEQPPPAAAESGAERTTRETTAALEAPEAPKPQAGSVTIDISRISPDGTSVFAGRAEPESYVTVLEDGKPAGTVRADANGEWSLATEHKFASTDPKLSFEVSRTAPPAPEPEKPAPKVAAAPAPPAAPSAAGEVMRKFESLVAEAREEARKTEEARKAQAGEAAKPAAPEAQPPARAETSAPAARAPDEQKTAAAPDSAAPAPPAQAPAARAEAAPSSGTAREAPSEARTAAAGGTASAAPKTDVIPVPLMFVYNEATLTPEGRRAADLLLEYLTLKRLSDIVLTGHADERGTDEYNFELSRERLETVSRLLRNGGYAGKMDLIPKGKTEPYMGVDRSAYSGEALYQLDRRVELRVSR